MEGTGKMGVALDGQKGIEMAGEKYAAYRLGEHPRQYQPHQEGLNCPIRGIPPFQDVPAPTLVKGMMEDKQQKHRRTYYLMGGLADQLIGHEKQQGYRHQGVYRHLYRLFSAHSGNASFRSADKVGKGDCLLLWERDTGLLPCPVDGRTEDEAVKIRR